MKNLLKSEEGRGVAEQITTDITATFKKFGFEMRLERIEEGVRSYHVELSAITPIRMKAVEGFLEDLRYALGYQNIEIEAPIPNKKLIGITVYKKTLPTPAPLLPVLSSLDQPNTPSLLVPLGISEQGEPRSYDLATAPHLLVAGTTDSGREELLHTFICSLISYNTAEQVRLILVDPSRVEFIRYSELPHLLTSVIHESRKALRALLWATKEMTRRYEILSAEGVTDIKAYHERIKQPAKTKTKKLDEDPEPLPYIVVVMAELNDYMQAYPREFEAVIIRLAQMGRAVGIHLILSTQRPSIKVIPAMIRANISSCIALAMASVIDSRTIIYQSGAEKLTGKGDMLFVPGDTLQVERIQGYALSEAEIKKLLAKRTREIVSRSNIKGDDVLDLSNENSNFFMASVAEDNETEDELYEDAKKAVIEAGKASTSYIQRKLRIGYSRAARLMDMLEEGGVIGEARGADPRRVIDRDK